MKREEVSHKRTHARVRISFPIKLTLKKIAPTIPSTLWGKTADLSEGGLSAVLENPLQVSSLMEVTIGYSLAPIEALAQVAWNRPIVNNGKFRCGIRFLSLGHRDFCGLRKILGAATSIITASYLPEKVITNQDIIDAGLKATPMAIERGLGVRERRAAAPDETAADMMAKVAKKILKKAECLPQELDYIICSADVGDSVEPDTATAVQSKIGASCPAFGVSMSCTGWLAAVDIALRYLDAGKKRILVLASSLVGSRIFYHNLMHRAIFGDGAGGILLESHHRSRFLGNILWTDGRHYSKIYIPHPWSIIPEDIPEEYKASFYMSPDQKKFFAIMDSYLVPVTKRLLKEAKVELQDIDLFFLHYPSKPLFDYSLKLLKIPREKTFSRFESYGNLAAAEVPVFLDEAVNVGRLKKGNLLLVVTYGAGFTGGGLVLRY
ncbi:MAG TPA: 3-oxoacyl-[acyl-carrier-protein] synthase III C-terminal domain-containing protein [bacterium]|nr:3-oxoacyl-[acyl-carrier-protein] synthase III C-terminal domain-containing protein [bacterium]